MPQYHYYLKNILRNIFILNLCQKLMYTFIFFQCYVDICNSDCNWTIGNRGHSDFLNDLASFKSQDTGSLKCTNIMCTYFNAKLAKEKCFFLNYRVLAKWWYIKCLYAIFRYDQCCKTEAKMKSPTNIPPKCKMNDVFI